MKCVMGPLGSGVLLGLNVGFYFILMHARMAGPCKLLAQSSNQDEGNYAELQDPLIPLTLRVVRELLW